MRNKWFLEFSIAYIFLFLSFGITFYNNNSNWPFVLIVAIANIIGWLLYYKLWITSNDKKRRFFILFFSISMILLLIPKIFTLFIDSLGSVLDYSVFVIIIIFAVISLITYNDIKKNKD
ncbi:MAG: hypothetical protein ACOC1O_03940 [bacterium]